MAVANRLRRLPRPGDTACRLGGDEFVVLCEDSGLAQADSVGERIHAALAAPLGQVSSSQHIGDFNRSTALTVSASLGIAVTTDPTAVGEQLLAEADADADADADAAMYRSKRG